MNKRNGKLIATGALVVGLTVSLGVQAQTTTAGSVVGAALAAAYHQDARGRHDRDHRDDRSHWDNRSAAALRKQERNHWHWHKKQQRRHVGLHQQDRWHSGHDFAWQQPAPSGHRAGRGHDGRDHDDRGRGERNH